MLDITDTNNSYMNVWCFLKRNVYFTIMSVAAIISKKKQKRYPQKFTVDKVYCEKYCKYMVPPCPFEANSSSMSHIRIKSSAGEMSVWLSHCTRKISLNWRLLRDFPTVNSVASKQGGPGMRACSIAFYQTSYPHNF